MVFLFKIIPVSAFGLGKITEFASLGISFKSSSKFSFNGNLSYGILNKFAIEG